MGAQTSACSEEERLLMNIIGKYAKNWSSFNFSVVLGHVADADKTFHFEMYMKSKGVHFNIRYDGKELYGLPFTTLAINCGRTQRFSHVVHNVLPKLWVNPMPEEVKAEVLCILQKACPASGDLTKAAH